MSRSPGGREIESSFDMEVSVGKNGTTHSVSYYFILCSLAAEIRSLKTTNAVSKAQFIILKGKEKKLFGVVSYDSKN